VLVPVGVQPSRDILYANWPELGHVLVAGLPGGGVDVILTSLIAALATRRRPENLRVWMVLGSTTLPDRLRAFPHQEAAAVAPWDESHLGDILARLRGELGHRSRTTPANGSGSAVSEEEWVLVISEVTELPRDPEIWTTLEMLGKDGPSVGLRMIVATTRPSGLDDNTLLYFRTRLVLAMDHEEESVILLGQPNAADLGRSELLAQIEGRRPVPVRGFKVSEDHLDQLVDMMTDVRRGHSSRETSNNQSKTEDGNPGDLTEADDVRSTAAEPAATDAAVDSSNSGNETTIGIPDRDQADGPSMDADPLAIGESVPAPPSSSDDEAPDRNLTTDEPHVNPALVPASIPANDGGSNGHIVNVSSGTIQVDNTANVVDSQCGRGADSDLVLRWTVGDEWRPGALLRREDRGPVQAVGDPRLSGCPAERCRPEGEADQHALAGRRRRARRPSPGSLPGTTAGSAARAGSRIVRRRGPKRPRRNLPIEHAVGLVRRPRVRCARAGRVARPAGSAPGGLRADARVVRWGSLDELHVRVDPRA